MRRWTERLLFPINESAFQLFRRATLLLTFALGVTLAADFQRIQRSNLYFPFFCSFRDVPHGAITAIFVVWLMCLGLYAKRRVVPLSGMVVMLGLVLGMLSDERLYSNHVYLLIHYVAILYLADLIGAAWWTVLLLRTQVSAMYVFAALSKLNTPFISGETLRDIGVRLPSPLLVNILALSIIATELLLPCLLWQSRFRRFGIAAGIVFHSAIVVISPDPELALFSVLVWVGYVAFFIEDVPCGAVVPTELSPCP